VSVLFYDPAGRPDRSARSFNISESIRDEPPTPMINEIVQDIEECEDPREQFELLIELGDQASPLEEKWKIENFRVQGCTSNVWLVALPDEDSPSGLRFLADSDAHLVRGLVTLVLHLVKDKSAAEIASYDFESKFDTLGLARHLSSARSNGLKSMADRVRQLASGDSAGAA